MCGIGKEMIHMNLPTKQKDTHRLREQAHGCWVEGKVRKVGIDMYTLLYLKWITHWGPPV